MGKNQQKISPYKHKSNKKQDNWPQKKQPNGFFKSSKPAFRKIKRRRRQEIINRLSPIYDRVNSQTGSELKSNFVKAGLDLGLKALSSEFGKKLINKGIDNIPNIFKFIFSKKNK